MIRTVKVANLAEKQLRKVPGYIKINLMIWIAAVEWEGLEEVRKAPGYHEATEGPPIGATFDSAESRLPGDLQSQAGHH